MPSNAGAIRAGRAYVEIYGDDSPLQKKLNSASQTMKDWGSKLTSIGTRLFAAGAAAKAALGGAIAVFEESGTQLKEMSLRTGISVESLSTLGFAASQSGVDMEGLENAIRKMQKAISGADEGSAEAAEALAKLGLTIDQVKGLSPDEQFRKIGARLAGISDPTTRAAEAMKIFGKTGTSILPMLANGAAGMAELEDKAKSLGLQWSGEDAEAAATLHHAMTALWDVIKKGTANVGAALASDLTGLVASATEIAAATAKWIKENKGLVIGLNLAAGSVLAVGAGLIVLGATLSAGGAILAAVGSVMAAILSPTALVIAAVVGLGVAVEHFTGAGGAAVAWISSKFTELRSNVEKSLGGISDALSAGNVQLAMKILWLSLKVEWTKGVNFLSEKWEGFNGWLLKQVIDAGFGIREIWTNLTFFMSEAWDGFITKFKHGWNDAQSWLAKRIIDVLEIVGGLTEREANDARKELGKGAQADRVIANLPPAGAAVPAGFKPVDARQDAIDKIHADRDALKAAVDAVNAAGKAADAAKLNTMIADLDAAIEEAKKNRKQGDAGEGATKNGFDADVATASKHGPIAGVDVKSTEGFKAILGAINEGQNNPQEDLANTQRAALALQKRQQKDAHDTLLALRKLNTVGF